MFSACLLSLPPEALLREQSRHESQGGGRAVERRVAFWIVVVTALAMVAAAIAH